MNISLYFCASIGQIGSIGFFSSIDVRTEFSSCTKSVRACDDLGHATLARYGYDPYISNLSLLLPPPHNHVFRLSTD